MPKAGKRSLKGTREALAHARNEADDESVAHGPEQVALKWKPRRYTVKGKTDQVLGTGLLARREASLPLDGAAAWALFDKWFATGTDADYIRHIEAVARAVLRDAGLPDTLRLVLRDKKSTRGWRELPSEWTDPAFRKRGLKAGAGMATVAALTEPLSPADFAAAILRHAKGLADATAKGDLPGAVWNALRLQGAYWSLRLRTEWEESVLRDHSVNRRKGGRRKNQALLYCLVAALRRNPALTAEELWDRARAGKLNARERGVDMEAADVGGHSGRGLSICVDLETYGEKGVKPRQTITRRTFEAYVTEAKRALKAAP